MFGYVNINREQISEENRKIYQSYYCGLCQCLRQHCGKRGQLVLNYDITFLVVLLTGLYETEGTVTKDFTCAIHPMKKRDYVINEITEYAVGMNVMLAYHNLVDDWKDDKNVAKMTMATALSKDYKRYADIFPRQARAIEEYMRKLSAYEKDNETNIDLVAGLTGEMLGELLDWKQDEWSHELRTLGFYLGKFIYLMDAYEDLEKDVKKNSYNPLRKLKADSGEDYETICRLMMTSMIGECAKSFERLPILLHAEILRNILYSGVWTKYEYLRIKKDGKNKGMG